MTRDDLELRRAQREADHLLGELQTLIEAYNRGEIELDVAAVTADRVGARMADLVLTGPLS